MRSTDLFVFGCALLLSSAAYSADVKQERRNLALGFRDISSLVGEVGSWLGFGRLLPMRTVMVFDEKGSLVLGVWSRLDDPLTQAKMDASMKGGAKAISKHPTRDEVLGALKRRSNDANLVTAEVPRRTVVEIDFPMGVCAPCSDMSKIVEKSVNSAVEVEWLGVGLDGSGTTVETMESLPSAGH